MRDISVTLNLFWIPCNPQQNYKKDVWSTTFIFSGLPYASKTADYYADDYNYSSDDEYPNGDGHDGINGLLGENEKIIHVTPQITSKSLDELKNEGDTIKLPCLVDKIGGF